MTSELEQYVKRIVQHTECSNEEKEDLYEELLVHLELLRDDFIQEGLSVNEAEQKAIAQFGEESEIGHGIQQAMLPYRKEMMLVLSISSLLFTVSAYLMQLFSKGDAYIGWLIFSMAVSSLLLFLPIQQTIQFNRRLWMNCLLVIHLIIYVWGYPLVFSLEHKISIILTIWIWMIFALSLVLIYRTTLYDYRANGELNKTKKILHSINLTTGLIINGACLFFLMSGLMLFGGFHPRMLLFASPIIVWLGLYIIQMKIQMRHKKAAWTIAAIPILFSTFVLLYFLFPVLSH